MIQPTRPIQDLTPEEIRNFVVKIAKSRGEHPCRGMGLGLLMQQLPVCAKRLPRKTFVALAEVAAALLNDLEIKSRLH